MLTLAAISFNSSLTQSELLWLLAREVVLKQQVFLFLCFHDTPNFYGLKICNFLE